MFGIKSSHWILIEQQLKRFSKVNCEVSIFGSRARGDFKEFSDLDVLIKCAQPNDLLLSDVREQLEESNIPIKVDLVLDSELANSYRENVYKDSVRLFN